MKFNPTEIVIRDLRESDLEAIIGLAESLKEAPHWPPEAYDSLVRPESSAGRIALVAVDSRSCQTIGFSIARLIAPEAELESIAVAQFHQRHGVGRKLLSALVQRLRRAGAETIHLEVRASNSAAIGFYNSFGFSEIGQRIRYYASPIEDAILMTLDLV